MSTSIDLPSYEELFGELDFKTGDEARSVYSPAAYLADLLQLLDDKFVDPEIDDRRSDIKNILLNAENTFGLVPYLDIVNEVLENKIGDNVYQTLQTSIYPFNLPFNLENERLKKYLSYLGVKPEQLYKAFALPTDADVVARDYLGLSPEEYTLVITPLSDEVDVEDYFHLQDNQSLQDLKDVESFLKATNLSGRALRDLLFQNLSESAKDTASNSERIIASEFFINHQLDGYVTLDDDEEQLVWSDDSLPIPVAWFERINRFVRLANKIGLSFMELDVVLRRCCGNQLNAEAIRIMAAVKQLHDRYELPLEEACSLFGPIDTLGIGDEPAPIDLFNRIFNLKFADIEKTFIPGSAFVPDAYSAYDSLTCSGDLQSLNNKTYRRRLVKALEVSDKDLTFIITQFREKYAQDETTSCLLDEGEIGLAALSLLYRISKLAEMLDISYAELFHLLNILEKDPSIRKHSNFNILIRTDIQEQDCYKIIEGGDVSALLWLVQVLFAVVNWMQANDFTAEELSRILSGSYKSQTEQENDQRQKINVLDALYQQFKPAMFNAGLFVSNRFSQRAARLIHQVLIDDENGLVSRQDKRLVRFDPALAASAAYKALTQLEEVKKEDLMTLGLEQRMLDKIFNNLIIKGFVDADGKLTEDKFPASAADFTLATDFSAHQEALFSLIHSLYSAEDIEQALYDDEDELLEIALYPTDLDALDVLSDAQRSELYDNLIFNGYIDEEGNILQTDLFDLEENWADFEVNVNLDMVSREMFERIAKQIKLFETEPLTLDAGIFSELSLTEAEVNDLMENLAFNDYIDENQVFNNKGDLLTQTADQLNLALTFYPYRHAILEALKHVIHAFKSGFYILNKEAFRDIADAAAAQRGIEHLALEYLSDSRLREEAQSFFLDRENLDGFDMGLYFTRADSTAIFDHLAAIFADQRTYQLSLTTLEALDFDEDEIEELVEELAFSGTLTNRLMLPEAKIGYFLNVNNALDFSVEGFEDYNKDIFFALHAVAKEIDAGMQEITEKVKALADWQEAILFEVLQDGFGLHIDIVKRVCGHIFRQHEHLVEEFVLPVLAAVDSSDTVSKEPDNNKFNFAYKQMSQFALLASKLGLSREETDIIFCDQDLAEKFPEKLILPEDVDRFDALLHSPEGIIYLFKGSRYWAYSAENYNLLETDDHHIASLSDRFNQISKVDAAFVDGNGTSFIVAQDQYFYKEKESKRWVKKERIWGKVNSNFDDPKQIDAAFQDKEGKTYLFSGGQYVRYSSDDYTYVDEGYPRAIAGNWKNEGLNAQLTARFQESIDASFQGTDEKVYLFKDDTYVCSSDLSAEMDIKTKWGRVRNMFEQVGQIDAAYTSGADYYIFAADQVIVYQDSIENEGVTVLEGYPRRIEAQFANLPAEFEAGIEAAFRGEDGQVHLFKDGKTIALSAEPTTGDPIGALAVGESPWGKVINKVLERGQIDAAFVGLDGKTYLFSDDQYIRYSGADYSQVDEGYPRAIAGDWGGLNKVGAAFVLDGKTYLFGTDMADNQAYVRYSKKDYSEHDEGYPQEPNDNWWNLPNKLAQPGAEFANIDAVFSSQDDHTYLFSGHKFIAFDNKHRWWSEPQELATQWDSIPFDTVDAAFSGKDGKTYIFSGKQYIRYSGSNFSKIDDRYPNTIDSYWGNVINNIARTGNVDAAIVVDSHEVIDEVEQTHTHTYLFSGNQYFRYVADQYEAVENGYPRYIATSLKKEPRFKNLDTVFENGIDAAFADRRNIYLFKDATCHVVSEALYKKYDDLGLTQAVDSAFIEDGSLFISENNAWQRYSALEGKAVQKRAANPTVLREVPDKFRGGLDAILKGVDGNTYLFKGQDCFNLLLNREYPLAEEWGQLKNNILINNTIDAAFVGRDNKTYLFSGEQFVTYPGHTYIGAEIDGHPQRISDHWGGLNSVALAYVRDNKTYLFEKADSEGDFRYLCYSSADYSQPDAGFPQTADTTFWQIPATYHQEGFDDIRAVLFEGDNMFLLSSDHYLQFNEEADMWSYPRPLSRIWRDIPLDNLSFPGLKTAFTAADGVTYFFSGENFISYGNHTFTAPAPIKNSWGLVQNNFAKNPKVDAAFVHLNKTTYLFSGDQYVRYSGQDYQYVDEGYPKPILDNLRKEAGFENLPDAFEDSLVDLVAGGTDKIFDAVVSNRRTIYLFIDQACHVASHSLAASIDLSLIGRVKNNIADQNRIDVAFVDDKGQTFLFCGDQYVRYSDDAYDYVDDGYPKAIAASFAAEVGLTTLPASFHYGLDASVKGADGSLYLFKGKQYLKLGDPELKAVNATWGKLNNRFVADPADKTIEAAFISPDGGLYLFKGGQYIRYQDVEQEFVDEGYPKAIKDNWGNLPVNFEAGIDGGFVFEGKTYLLKGDDYVRYSYSHYRRIDSIYPQKFRYRWGPWADYLLSDLKTIARFKQLQKSDNALADFLNTTYDDIETPYQMLSDIFGWDIDELKWLKRNNGFSSTDHLFEDRFQLELLIKLVDQFALTDKIGAAPSDVYTNVWRNLYAVSQPDAAAAALYRYLGMNNSEEDWQTLSGQIHDELNTIKRNVLVPYVISQDTNIENSRDLYEQLLIDVDMESCGITSRIKEAIAATQLYFHRYFVNLERLDIKGDSDEVVKQEIRAWWTWMKNYRVWEANRKVFLYPENYIRPELRDTKTPAFKTLEEDLLQAEITDPAVQRAYKKYLDEYTEVSRLTIAGGYVYNTPESSGSERRLVLFGRTKTDPGKYYYRMAEFLGGEQDATLWGPWLDVNVQIEADKVYPVYAFNRVFVFWAKIETVADSSSSTTMTTTQSGDTQTFTADARATYLLKIFYSYYNLNEEWVQAQALNAEISHDSEIGNLNLFVEHSDKLTVRGSENSHENIIINCAYDVGGTEMSQAFSLTPELYTEQGDKPRFVNSGQALFSHLFAEPVIAADKVVMLNTPEESTDGPWFSFDHKGGSFLCMPAVPPLKDDAWPRQLANNDDGLPKWRRIDAAFEGAEGKLYFFNNSRKIYLISEAGKLGSEQNIKYRWGKIRNNIAETGLVDAALTVGYKIYLFSGNEYLTYSGGLDLADADGPKTLANNSDRLPRWGKVDAAFQGKDGRSYFFNNAQKIFVSATASGLSAKRNTKAHWGKMKGIPDPVAVAFTWDDYTYLVYGDQYVRYKGSNYDAVESGYPQPFTELADISDFEIKGKRSIDPSKITSAFYYGVHLYFQYQDETPLYRLRIYIDRRPRDPFRNRLGLGLPLQAVVYHAGHIYAFRTKSENDTPFHCVCIFDVANNEWPSEYHDIRIYDRDNNKITIDHVLAGKDGNLYLFRGDEYMRAADLISLIKTDNDTGRKYIAWSKSGSIGQDWLGITNNILETGMVDAALVRGNHTYLFCGDQYVRYTGKDYDLIDEGYPKRIQGNTENIPAWNGVDAAFNYAGKSYFFDNGDQTYVESGRLGHKLQTRQSWGIIRNNFTASGRVDSAYVRDNRLFLSSGNEFVRYSLTAGQAPGEFVDQGYPKTNRWGWSRIDAAFTQGNKTYLFTNQLYSKLGQSAELDNLTPFRYIKGNWGNLPHQLKWGCNAALNSGDELYLFKGGRYIKYESPIMPYEIWEVEYNIIRLSMSTAYKLNQKLFAEGLSGLLNISTQKIDELPAFSSTQSTPTTIRFRPDRMRKVPVSSHLDFDSANGIYYWEIFFHAPFLLAQALNTSQKFDDAKTWYEHIFDPTEVQDYWKFLPFLQVDTPNSDAEIKKYLNDPFDPHAIAALRRTAYRKAIVMAYIDNLLDWGDMLFRQYTMESINEARMLYVLAHDLLGEKPENLGIKVLPDDKKYNELSDASDEYDFLIAQANAKLIGNQPITVIPGTIHDSVANPYFFIPENVLFSEYWNRVEDRLHKIRHCLNIMGVSQPLPLFQPPIDPMAIVQAVGAGAGLSQAIAAAAVVPVPHYRFEFLLGKAQNLVAEISQLGSELLAVLEKKDAEELSRLHTRHEGIILSMTQSIKEAQLQEAEESINALNESLGNAEYRVNRYQEYMDEGMTDLESAQAGLMITGASLHGVAAIVKVLSAIAHAFPQSKFGVFILGAEIGGEQLGPAIDKVAEALESGGEAFSMAAEAVAVYAAHERMVEEWVLQKALAESDVREIQAQIKAAEWRKAIAEQEINILDKEIEHNRSIATFMTDKFTNAELYQWMSGKLSAIYFQTYKLAHDMAKSAEVAFQYERGYQQSAVNYIQPMYWDSQRKGILAAESLALDLNRMEAAFIQTDQRRLEISKNISLLELDPVAFLQLKAKGVCEFSLSEALFDYDFQGHYCRQIKTIALTFDAGQGQTVMATLTQLNHKTLLEADAKAVKYLLDPKDQPPLSIRSDWKANQQIALSHTDEYEKNNGLFELRFDDPHYLPFESTGAVSTWRLELNGKKGSYDVGQLLDVVVNVKYTALQGGEAFANAVRGLLKPYQTARFFDMAYDFPDEWAAFLEGDSDELVLPFTRDLFPNMGSSKISGIFTKYELSEPDDVSMTLNHNDQWTLEDGKYLPASGLTISSRGSDWVFTIDGDKQNLVNINLVLGYKATV